MSDVKKIKNACLLASLESFFHDHGIQLEQECMMQVLINKKLCATDGVIPFGRMKEAFDVLNLKITEVPYHYPIDKKYEDGSLLIGTKSPGFHCMRFLQQVEDGKIFVMDPDVGTSRYCDKADLESYNPTFYQVEIL